MTHSFRLHSFTRKLGVLLCN